MRRTYKEVKMPLEPLTVPGHAGKLHIENYSSILVTSDENDLESSYLLLIHNSPSGVPDSQTAGQATAYLEHDLGKHEGSPLTVWGIVATVGHTPAIAMMKAQ
jgi:hypothetical protein